MIWCWSQRCSVDRKSTRLNSSHQIISYAVFCLDRKSTRLNSSHQIISYAVFCLKKKNTHLNSSHQIISYAVFCFKKKTKPRKEYASSSTRYSTLNKASTTRRRARALNKVSYTHC